MAEAKGSACDSAVTGRVRWSSPEAGAQPWTAGHALPSARPQESTCTTAGKLLVRICGSCGLSPSEPHAAEACCCRLSEAIRPNVWPLNGEPFCWSIPRVLQPHGTWWLLGRRVVFVASAHIFHRPLCVITDSESPEPREYSPPPIIDESCWGPPVFLAASLDRHFGSTERLCDAMCLDLPEPRKCIVAPFARGMLAAPESFQCKELNQELILGSLTRHQDKMLLRVSRASDYKELPLEVILPCMSWWSAPRLTRDSLWVNSYQLFLSPSTVFIVFLGYL